MNPFGKETAVNSSHWTDAAHGIRALAALRGALTRRRVLTLGGLGAVGIGMALNWDWLTAVGAAPVILALLPCAVMCGLGVCMMRCQSAKTASCSGSATASDTSQGVGTSIRPTSAEPAASDIHPAHAREIRNA